MIIRKDTSKTVLLVALGLILMIVYQTYTMNRLHDNILFMKGKVEAIDQIRMDIQQQRLLFERQLDINDKQIQAFHKIDSTMELSLKVYSDGLQQLKKKHNEKITIIADFGSDQLRSYFTELPLAK